MLTYPPPSFTKMYSLDPEQCYFYPLLPDCDLQTPGQNFTGEIIIEWIFLDENSSQPTTTVFSYIDGAPEGFIEKGAVPIHNILKMLMLGSATVIRFPAYGTFIPSINIHIMLIFFDSAVMFPRAAKDKYATL